MKKSSFNPSFYRVVCVLFAAILIGVAARLLLTGIETIDPVALRKIVGFIALVLLPITAVLLCIVSWMLGRFARHDAQSDYSPADSSLAKTAVAIVCALAIGAQPCFAQSRPVKTDNDEKILGIIVGVAIIIGGFWVGWKVWHLADQKMPKVNAKPPKPPKANTNAPSNTAMSPVAGTFFVTNGMWDISEYAVGPEWADPDGKPFTMHFTNTIQTSRSQAFSGDTQTFTLLGWLSDGWQEYVLYRDGTPIDTNLSPRTCVPVIESGIDAPQQFARMIQ